MHPSPSVPTDRYPSIYKAFWAATALLVLVGWSSTARGQEAHYSLAFRGVPLDQALEQFVDATGIAVAYDPRLVRAHRAYCATEDQPAEAVLRCILKESGLDFYQLSSGTYVLTAPAELPTQPGYLSGLVTDRETGAPLADANVYLKKAELGAVTNRAGQFTLPPLLPGSYIVRITHIGYHAWQDTLRVTARDRTHATAALRSEPIVISPVVIDGIQPRSASAELGRSRLATNRNPVGLATHPQATYRALNTLSGVRMNDITADVHLQGGDTGDHQLRLDSVPVYLPRTTLGLIGPFSAFALDRITVQKAGFDAAQGSQTAGLILAKHAVAAEDGFDVQMDPLSLDARAQFAPSLSGSNELAVMAAARIGLWNVYEPPRLHATLEDWSAPDPFLITASTSADRPAPVDSALSGFRSTNPTATFSDLHAAARLRLSPLRTLHASLYRGHRRIQGGVSDQPGTAQANTQPTLMTVTDDYQWHNTLGQVRYDAVLGNHTLLDLQLRGSQYTLQHDYRILDSLRFSTEDGTSRLVESSTLPVEDGNRIRTVALDGSLDHARGRHHIEAGAELTYTRSSFGLYGIHLSRNEELSNASSGFGSEFGFANLSSPQRISHAMSQGRIAAFASDDLTWTDRLSTEAGVRLTYLPGRATVYAEPRLALRYDRAPWSMRTAAGLYRKFTYQTDVSVLNAGSLLPSVRVWLPLDASVRPPRAYHLTHEILVRPTDRWRVRLEGYFKHQPHRLTLRYTPASELSLSGELGMQRRFLAHAQGQAYGGALSAEWKSSRVRVRGEYEYSHATQRSAALFDGRTVPVPWNEPHRLELGVDWMPTAHLTVSARGRGVWGRSWGFRRVYYDYFGQSRETRFHGGYDFGRPSDHVLPPLYRLDLSVAYARSLGPTALQVRVDVLNATGRTNVADWRLAHEAGTWQKQPRHLYPRLPAAAVRVSF